MYRAQVQNTLVKSKFNAHGADPCPKAEKFKKNGKDTADGKWWVKYPFYHTKNSELEATYVILYYSANVFVYRTVLNDLQPYTDEEIYVKVKQSYISDVINKQNLFFEFENE